MTEKEYIEREAAIAEVEEWHDMYPDSDAAREALSFAKLEIRKLPAVDVRPVVRGKWIDIILQNDNGDLPVIVCDQCNTFYPLQFGASHRFCPNCGADMREEAEQNG